MKDKKTIQQTENDTFDTRSLKQHCIVLDQDSRDILDEVKTTMRKKGNFRANYSQIIRYCLATMNDKGNWSGLEFTP